MTTPDKDAMREALEAMVEAHERNQYHSWEKGAPDYAGALKKARAALAQPSPAPVAASPSDAQGEPVAYCEPANPLNHEAFAWQGTLREPRHSMPLYAAPQPAAQSTPTDEEGQA